MTNDQWTSLKTSVHEYEVKHTTVYLAGCRQEIQILSRDKVSNHYTSTCKCWRGRRTHTWHTCVQNYSNAASRSSKQRNLSSYVEQLCIRCTSKCVIVLTWAHSIYQGLVCVFTFQSMHTERKDNTVSSADYPTGVYQQSSACMALNLTPCVHCQPYLSNTCLPTRTDVVFDRNYYFDQKVII